MLITNSMKNDMNVGKNNPIWLASLFVQVAFYKLERLTCINDQSTLGWLQVEAYFAQHQDTLMPASKKLRHLKTVSITDCNNGSVDVFCHNCFILIRPWTTCETTSVEIIEVRLESSPGICPSVALPLCAAKPDRLRPIYCRWASCHVRACALAKWNESDAKRFWVIPEYGTANPIKQDSLNLDCVVGFHALEVTILSRETRSRTEIRLTHVCLSCHLS